MKKLDHIIFFDGVCKLCNKYVSLLIKVDRNKVFRYSTLQGKYAKSISLNKKYQRFDSVIFFTQKKVFIKSEAIIRILKQLGGYYLFLGMVLSLFPRFFLNIFYDLIAKNRYLIFGRLSQCRVPNKEEADLFLD